jgi:hypothetical protein
MKTCLIDSAAIMSARSDFKVLKQNETLLRTKQTFENSKRFPDFGIKYDHMLAFRKTATAIQLNGNGNHSDRPLV